MKLCIERLKDIEKYLDGKVKLPLYNIEEIKENTMKSPKWLHFGGGNIFRGFMGKVQQTLIEKGIENTGIIVAESFDTEIIDKVYAPFDNLSMLVTLDKEGNFKNEILGSIVEAIKVSEETMLRLEEIVNSESLEMISFTITEKGYNLKNTQGEYIEIIKNDFENGYENPKHIMGIITSLLYKRYKKNNKSLSLVSMDNCSENGDKIKNAVIDIAENWIKNGKVEKEFINYVSDEKKVAYPISMIDKITPRPAEVIVKHLEELGFEDMEMIITSKNTYTAPFINAEIAEYFIVEDKFPNGRPKLEEAGIYITDRETVEKTEVMKVTTCLNPLHTTLAIYGCLLNQKTIYEAVTHRLLKKLVNNIGYKEGLPVVKNPKILDPKEFIDEVLNERFPNPYIPDQPERIATDTSQKIGIRFGETIKSYENTDGLRAKNLKYIPLVIAGWFRYLLGVDDNGNKITISSDPLLEILKKELEGIEFGKSSSYQGQLKLILKNKNIFGVDLEEVGLSVLIEKYFVELIETRGAVVKTLEKYL